MCLCGDAHLNLTCLEITRNDSLQHLNGSLDGLLGVPVALLLFPLLLELCHRLLLFSASGNSAEADSLPGWINSVYLRAELVIVPDNCCVNAERSHVSLLRELLEVVAELLCEHGNRNHISILELELGSSVSEPGDHELRVLHVAHDHCTDIVIDAKDISDGICHDETIGHFLLGANDD